MTMLHHFPKVHLLQGPPDLLGAPQFSFQLFTTSLLMVPFSLLHHLQRNCSCLQVFIPQVLMFVTMAFLSCFPSCASSSEPVAPWKTILGHVSYHHNVYLPYSPLFNPSIKSLYQGWRKHFRIGQAMKFFHIQSIHFTLVTVHPLQVTHNTIAMKFKTSHIIQ